MARILFVIPFYHGDKGQAERLAKWIKALSGGKRVGERALVVSTPSAPIGDFPQLLKGSFDKVQALQQTFGPDLEMGENPWPKACNHQFLSIAELIATNEAFDDIDAFYYFEPDNLPLVPDWWDRICEDYEKQGKPFYGVSSTYIERITGKAYLDGDHMIGTGIYPRQAWHSIKGYQELVKNPSSQPWDAVTRDEVNPHCHFTNLIAHAHHSHGYRLEDEVATAVYRPNLDPEMKRRPVAGFNEAVILHGCKDSSLRLMLAHKLGLVQDEELTFAHSGDIGDLIFGLCAMKHKGGGILKIGKQMGGVREALEGARLEALLPLLKSQPYVRGLDPHEGEWVDFDFRMFRAVHKEHSNLVHDQLDWIGCPLSVGDEPWLTISPLANAPSVVINRTERYRNDDFPWRKVLSKYPDAVFIGLPHEHENFEKDFGSVRYVSTDNFFEVAEYIASSILFIGNQSACGAVAEALKHQRIQETHPDTATSVFPEAKNAIYWQSGPLILPARSKDEALSDARLSQFADKVVTSQPSSVPFDPRAILSAVKADPKFAAELKRALGIQHTRARRKKRVLLPA